MLRTFHLHGPLATDGGKFTVECATVAEGIEMITSQLPSWKGSPRRVAVVGHDSLEDLHTSEETEIHILPQLTFGKDSGLVQVIVGAALIAVGVAMGGVFWPAIVIGTGISMVISGVLTMVAPQPDLALEDQERSRYLGAAQNTVRIGTPIPVLYGERDIGGHLLSLNVDAKETT